MLMLCCGIGGLWYEEVLLDRRVAAVKADAARMVAYRAKLAENFESDLECELYCGEENETPEVVCVADSAPIVPAVLGERGLVPNSAPVLVKRAEQASVALIRSPITMKSMCASRAPGAMGRFTRGGKRSDWDLRYESACVIRSNPTTERYAEFAENEFVSPKSEPLSTFGLDVDTSSYSLMRSSISDQKCLPPKNSITLLMMPAVTTISFSVP